MSLITTIRVVLLVIITASIISCAGENFAKICNLRSAGETIICFGDSLTEGVGAEAGEDYPSVLSRLLVLPVINAGVGANTTADALMRLPDAVLSKNPRLVIVWLGANDFLRQVPRPEVRKNIEEIIRRIQDRGAMVAIAGIELGWFTVEYSAIFEETARQYGALYIPQVMKGVLADGSLHSDPIHPNGAGYRRIAERIAEKIKPLLREADRLRVVSSAR